MPFPSETEAVHVRGLRLIDFRNYGALDLALDAAHVVLVGENGAGKTNLMEAVSLLSPGRGLRRATIEDMGRLRVPAAGRSPRASRGRSEKRASASALRLSRAKRAPRQSASTASQLERQKTSSITCTSSG